MAAVELADAAIFIVIGVIVGVALIFVVMQSRISKKAEQLSLSRKLELDSMHTQRTRELTEVIDRRSAELKTQFDERKRELENIFDQRKSELDSQHQQRTADLDAQHTQREQDLTNHYDGLYKAEYEKWKAQFIQETDQRFLERVKIEKERAVNISRVVLKGKTAEQLAPLFPEFVSKYVPADARFIGAPVDFVVFKNLHTITANDPAERKEVEVVFVEVKAGNSKNLNANEKSVKAAIDNLRVKYEILKLSQDQGTIKIEDGSTIESLFESETETITETRFARSTSEERTKVIDSSLDSGHSNRLSVDATLEPEADAHSFHLLPGEDRAVMDMKPAMNFSQQRKRELCPRCNFGLKCDCTSCPNCPNNYAIESDSPQ